MERCSSKESLVLGTMVLTVRAGLEPDAHEDFTVHDNLIRTHSPFIDAAMRNDWKEAQERLIKMPETDPVCFHIYVQWLYSSRIHSAVTTAAKPGSTIWAYSKALNREFDTLVGCWIMGDVLRDTDFQDATMDILMKLCRTIHGLGIEILGPLAHYVYAHTTGKTSPLKALLVAHTTVSLTPRKMELFFKEDYPKDFVTEVLSAVYRRWNNGNTGQLLNLEAKCETYHQHYKTGGPCYKDKLPKPMPL
ncbi:uncharacterized protein BDZ99DRAFT_470711 [Mytilinidion resinicola]|uniref:BTB domain-containing protein n=1 Tax=Mytilinidion resinicola TaxID=574789 RepID=A0A6A6ZBQ4_9PEZI|nr:uncharacterized protein BDZ99DRAFT_470711 [Mytilinidion resinicola]KAF2817745.1 hypothetical protein BDZ99DRAFT_470711 [Mytilinidion resinicola]